MRIASIVEQKPLRIQQRPRQVAEKLLAAGGCQLETLKVLYQLSAPAILHEPTRRRFPLFVRMVLWIIGANDFMQLSTSEARGR